MYHPVLLDADVRGRAASHHWTFGDGGATTNQTTVHHAWEGTGSYSVVFTAYNDSNPTGVSAGVVMPVGPPVYLVVKDNKTPAWPFHSWSTAAATIQDAVDACTVPGTRVLVGGGTHATGGAVTPGGLLMNRVTATNDILIVSANGPDATVIHGQGPIGDSAVRGVYLSGGATLSGFTITEGHTWDSGRPTDLSGGGVMIVGDGSISNCVVTGNAARKSGGGVHGGTIEGSRVTDNAAQLGGGVSQATISDSIISGNSADLHGGGAYTCTISRCTVIDNETEVYGGGLFRGLAGDSLVVSNRAALGGGASHATLINCTVADNSAGDAGGVYACALRNAVVAANHAGDPDAANWLFSSFRHSCTLSRPAGIGNITNPPAFVDPLSGDYRLSSSSMCINAGSNADASALDRDGNPRIQASVVDMGAFESSFAPIDARATGEGAIVPSGRQGIPAGSNQTFTFAPGRNGLVDDVRVDGVSVGPTNAYTFLNVISNHTVEVVFVSYPDSSGLAVATVEAGGPPRQELRVKWESETGWQYSLQSCTSLTQAAWSNVVPFTGMTATGVIVITNSSDTRLSSYYRLVASPQDD